MKRLLITALVFSVALFFWFFQGNQSVDRNNYITQNILDMSRPVNVTIDIEFLETLVPAYEHR